jgi:hypothetical protein
VARARPHDAETTLEGTVERLVYSGGDGTFTVARLKLERGGDVVTVVGALVGVPAGAVLRVSGRFETTQRFGDQFRVSRYTEVAPQTIEGLRRYLGSGLIKGIGPEFASRIVDRFGIETLEILDSDPGRISEVPGIGPSRARAIRTGVERAARGAQGDGVPAGLRRLARRFARASTRRYGAAAIARVREEPVPAGVRRAGASGSCRRTSWRRRWAVARDAPARAEAGVRHVRSTRAERPRVRAAATAGAERRRRCSTCPRTASDAAIDRLAKAGDVALDASVGPTIRARPAAYEARAVPRRDRRGGPACASCSAAPAPRASRSRAARARLVRTRGRDRAGPPAGRGA